MYTMKRRDKDNRDRLYMRERLSLEGLQGRQSVRATFQLPHRIIDLLGAVASQFGVKQKSLIDSLLEDRQTLIDLAESSESEELFGDEMRRKTFVISRKTLQTLEELSRQSSVHRDQLLAISIARLFPVVVEEQAKHGKRQALLAALRAWQAKGRQLLNQAEGDLGSEDQFFQLLSAMLDAAQRQFAEIEDLIAKGKVMAELRLENGQEEEVAAASKVQSQVASGRNCI